MHIQMQQMQREPHTGICYIVGAGEGKMEVSPSKNDYLIAADGGYARLQGRKPDLVVGDFDSLGYIPEEEHVVRHPIEKDDTDMMLAVKLGLEAGYRSFIIYGALGGRLDHTIANIQTLNFLMTKGAKACLSGEDQVILLLKNEMLRFQTGLRGTASVFSYGEQAKGVNLKGLFYPLVNATLSNDFPLGVSNEFTGNEAEISVEAGTLLVMWEGDINQTDYFDNGDYYDFI